MNIVDRIEKIFFMAGVVPKNILSAEEITPSRHTFSMQTGGVTWAQLDLLAEYFDTKSIDFYKARGTILPWSHVLHFRNARTGPEEDVEVEDLFSSKL